MSPHTAPNVCKKKKKDKMTSKKAFPEGFKIPFCAFNGNRDVWVDVGDKR